MCILRDKAYQSARMLLFIVTSWLGAASVVTAASFDLATGFNPVTNPGSPWSCGWFSSIGGQFQPLTFRKTSSSDNGVTLVAWQYSSSEQPAVNWNGSTNVALVYGGLSSFAPGDVFMHPGPDGSVRNYGAVRFTVPVSLSGLYRIETSVAAVLTNGPTSDTDFYVVKNGREVVGWVLPAGEGVSYTNQMQLAAGDTVDFLIGRGADGREYGGALKLRARFVTDRHPPIPLAFDSANFSASTNPGLVWSYGWMTNIGGNFMLLTYAKSTVSDNGVPFRAWQYSASEQPAVNWNSTTNLAIIYGGRASLAGGEILFHPGPDGTPRNFGVIRLTVPFGQGGTYRLESAVAAVLTNSPASDTDFHIAVNGTEIFGRFLAAGQGAGFTNQLTLLAGDTVDFLIGRGADGHEYGGALKIRARLVAEPIPPMPTAFDMSNFSAATNPGPVWSYGWVTNIGGRFQTLTYAKSTVSDNGLTLRAWQYSASEQPAVNWNSTTNVAVIYGGMSSLAGGEILFHPGPDGTPRNFGVIRLTVPSGRGGNYRLESAVAAVLTNGPTSDTDFHIAVNDMEIFGRFLAAGQGTGFTNQLSLSAGDTVDFLIGRGADGHEYGGALKIRARLVALPVPPLPAVFDVADFSPAANPGPVWSYGWFTNIGGRFTLLTYAKTPPADNGVPINSWQYSAYEQPVVAWNGTTNVAIVFGGQTAFPPGSVWFHPGPDGSPRNFGAIRFTMPAGCSGSYRLESTVWAVLTNSPAGDTDFHIVKNGTEIFGRFLAAGQGTGFTNDLMLATGDTVDFLIGRGEDGHEYGGALKIAARFVPVNVVTSQPPVIVAQPQSRSVVVGSNVVFTVTAVGTQPLSYRWLFNNGMIASATNPSLAIDNVQPAQAGDYRAVVSNAAGSVTSAIATLTVVLPLGTAHDLVKDFSPTNNPNGVWRYGYKQAIGGSFSNLAYHRVFLSGEGVPIQVWEFSPNGDPAVFLNGTTDTATSDGGAGVYPPGTVWFAPGFDGQPQNFGAIRFTVPPAGSGLYRLETSARTYLDRSPGGDTDFHVVKNGVALFDQFLATPSETGYTNVISLVSGETIDFLVGRGQDGRLYGSGLKIKATLTRIETNAAPPVILAQPQSQTVVPGSSATFVVTAGGTPPLSYQWWMNGGALASATNSTLALNNVQPAQAGDYRVMVANAAGSVTSAVATLTVTGPSNAVWNVSSFSAATNPGAVWSYGWFTNLGGNFVPLTYAKTSMAANGVPVQSWQHSSFEQPAVYWNGTTNTAVFNGGQSVCPPGTVWAHPGPDGSVRNFGAVRFTVPAGAAGVYRLESAFRALLDGGTAGDTEIHVLHNGVEVFGQNLAARAGTGYTNSIQLAAGDRVDFAVGRGQDGVEYASALKIAARFVPAVGGSNQPPRVAGIEYLGDGQVEVRVDGILGSPLEIQVSTNLAHWSPLTTGINRNGTIRFADPDRLRAPMRFYRARPTSN